MPEVCNPPVSDTEINRIEEGGILKDFGGWPGAAEPPWKEGLLRSSVGSNETSHFLKLPVRATAGALLPHLWCDLCCRSFAHVRDCYARIPTTLHHSTKMTTLEKTFFA